ncbi:MAG: DUF3429 domain-containing protein [Rhodomicrobium sp.]
MPAAKDAKEVFEVHEQAHTTALGLILGYGATFPFVAGAAAAAFFGDADLPKTAANFTVLWGAAILLFLSGVRRGLSFRTPHGPTVSQIATSLWYFAGGIGSLFLWAARGELGSARPALALLLIGYVSVIVLDVPAARRLEAPPYFARLRPLQMLIPIACLGYLLIFGAG